MDRDDVENAEFRRNLILASALIHTPMHKDELRANCFRVLRHALMAAGLWDQKLEARYSEAFHGITEDFPSVELWYSTLIEMTREAESERLLEGYGNLDLPAGAYFTACWLTPTGRRAAEKLLVQHPDWEVRLRSPSART